MRIAGAAGIETATGPEPGTQQQLVPADHPQQDLAQGWHRCVIDFQCLSRLARKSLELALRAASRAETVTSTGGGGCLVKRMGSRGRRFVGFRGAALPTILSAFLHPD